MKETLNLSVDDQQKQLQANFPVCRQHQLFEAFESGVCSI